VRHNLKLTTDGDRWTVTGAVDLAPGRHPIVVAAAKLLKDGVASRADELRVEWPGTTFTVSVGAVVDYRPSQARLAAERPWRDRRWAE